MVRFGVVGTSWIAGEFIRCGSLIEDFRLSAIYSRSEERAKKVAKEHNGKCGVNVFTDLIKMAKSNVMDAVYIASPNSLHAKQAIEFMNNKKHVLCEKPIASNSRELMLMINAARENNVLLMEAMKSNFLPNLQVISKHLYKIGKVRRYLGNYCQYSMQYDLYKGDQLPNSFNPIFSTGSLMDIGIYCLYPLVYLFGKPKNIQAGAVILDSGVDGEGNIYLEYDGMDAIIMYSQIANSCLPSEIQGEEGCIIIDSIAIPRSVEIIYRDGTVQNITQHQTKNIMYYEIQEFISLIHAGSIESKINSHQLSLEVMTIMEAARKKMGLIFPAD